MKHIFFYIFILSLGLFSCHSSAETVEEQAISAGEMNIISLTKQQFEQSNYRLGKAEQQLFSSQLKVSGMVDVPMKNNTIVSNYFGGKVSYMNLLQGQYVQKGSVLYQLTNPEFITMQQAFLQSKHDIAFLKNELERQQILSDENISAKKNLQEAEYKLKKAKSEYYAMEQKLKLLSVNTEQLTDETIYSTVDITAPISGYLTQLNINDGMTIAPSFETLVITSTGHKHVELKVMEKDFNRLKKEQLVQIMVEDKPGTVFTGNIHMIDQFVDENHMINVHCHLDDDANKSLVAGMYVKANILEHSKNGFALPETAIVKVENKHYVLVQQGTELNFKKIMVEVGETQNGFVEIKNFDELSENSVFLLDGAYYLI